MTIESNLKEQKISEIQISFCVTVYNIASYITECIDSITSVDLNPNQYEILCIDDCSTDNSREILKKSAQKYQNIRIILNSENMGVSYSRNILIKEALGKYIWFVDGDDILNFNAVVPMLKNAMKLNADVFIGNYSRFIDGDNTPKINSYNFDYEETYMSPCDDNGLKMWAIWAGLFKKDFLIKNGLLFHEEMIAQEDTLFYWNIKLCCPKQYKCRASCYFYRLRPTSVMHTMSEQRSKDYYLSMVKMLQEYSHQLTNIPDEFKDELLGRIHHSYENLAYKLAQNINTNYVKSELKKLKNEGLYPYPFRKECFKTPWSFVKKLIIYFLPIEFVFWTFHFAYKLFYKIKTRGNQNAERL